LQKVADGDAKVNKLLNEKESVVVHFRVQTAQEALIQGGCESDEGKAKY
jgi:hypothetical protein